MPRDEYTGGLAVTTAEAGDVVCFDWNGARAIVRRRDVVAIKHDAGTSAVLLVLREGGVVVPVKGPPEVVQRHIFGDFRELP